MSQGKSDVRHGIVPTRSIHHNQRVPRLVLGTGVCPHCGGNSVRQNAAGDYWCYLCGWWQYDSRKVEV